MLQVAVLTTITVPLLLVGCGGSAATTPLPQNEHATSIPTVAPTPTPSSTPVNAHAAGLAAAKCSAPVQEKIRTKRDLRNVVVSTVPPDQLRVSGVVTDEAGVLHQWACVVSPDATDKLRGLKIDRLITSS